MSMLNAFETLMFDLVSIEKIESNLNNAFEIMYYFSKQYFTFS